MKNSTKLFIGVLLGSSLTFLGGCQKKTSEKSTQETTISTSKVKESTTQSTTATKESSTTTTSTTTVETTTSSQKAPEVKEVSMNLAEIKQGNYTSLMGDWEEVGVYFMNRQGTYSGPSGTPLIITPETIENLNTVLTNHQVQNQGKAFQLKESNRAGGLNLYADASNMQELWEITFYPKGVAIPNGEGDESVPSNLNDISKERIVVGVGKHIGYYQRKTVN